MKRILAFLGLYFLWLVIAAFSTLGGVFLVMLFADWSIGSLLASGFAWPTMGLAAVAGIPISLIGFGSIYFYSAVGGGLLFNLIVLIL